MIDIRELFKKKGGTEISELDAEIIAELRKALKGYRYQIEIERKNIIVKIKRE